MMVAGGARLRAPRVVYPGGDDFYGGGLERHTSLRRPATLKKQILRTYAIYGLITKF
jgi:hypothetical protein